MREGWPQSCSKDSTWAREPKAGAKKEQNRQGTPQRVPQWRTARKAGPVPGAMERQ